MRVVIDPGHGGIDPGALHGANRESVIALQMSSALNVAMSDAAIDTLLTRDTDVEVSLSQRVAVANDWPADCFISMHLNADPDNDEPGNRIGSGAEIWYYPSKKSSLLAWCVASELRKAWPLRFRGTKASAELYVLRQTRCPAILIEAGFIDSAHDLALMDAEHEHALLAGLITTGVIRWGETHGIYS